MGYLKSRPYADTSVINAEHASSVNCVLERKNRLCCGLRYSAEPRFWE